jgi:aspartate/methionine/tyrosine aminotransferase
MPTLTNRQQQQQQQKHQTLQNKKKQSAAMNKNQNTHKSLETLPPNATMRDIFDFCQEKKLPSVAQGMIEVDPPKKLLSLAGQYLHMAGEESIHMYRSRTGESEFLEGVVHMLIHYYHFPENLISTACVFATHGVTGACVSLFNLMLQDGRDKIGLIYPFYTYHLKQIYSVFGNGHPVQFIKGKPCDESHAQVPMIDFDDLENSYFQQGKIDCLIICNPCNPTTQVWPKKDLHKLVVLCEKYNIVLLIDECYCDMVWSGSFYTPLFRKSEETGQLEMYPNVVVARGFSKNLGCQSWRVGYAIAHPSLITKMVQVADPIYICVPWLQQPMGKYLKENLSDFSEHLNSINELIRSNWILMRDAFVEALGWEAIEPLGTMYGLFKHNKSTDMEAVLDALSKGVGVTPYNIFLPGTPANSGIIRIHCGISREKAKLIVDTLLRK